MNIIVQLMNRTKRNNIASMAASQLPVIAFMALLSCSLSSNEANAGRPKPGYEQLPDPVEMGLVPDRDDDADDGAPDAPPRQLVGRKKLSPVGKRDAADADPDSIPSGPRRRSVGKRAASPDDDGSSVAPVGRRAAPRRAADPAEDDGSSVAPVGRRAAPRRGADPAEDGGSSVAPVGRRSAPRRAAEPAEDDGSSVAPVGRRVAPRRAAEPAEDEGSPVTPVGRRVAPRRAAEPAEESVPILRSGRGRAVDPVEEVAPRRVAPAPRQEVAVPRRPVSRSDRSGEEDSAFRIRPGGREEIIPDEDSEVRRPMNKKDRVLSENKPYPRVPCNRSIYLPKITKNWGLVGNFFRAGANRMRDALNQHVTKKVFPKTYRRAEMNSLSRDLEQLDATELDKRAQIAAIGRMKGSERAKYSGTLKLLKADIAALDPERDVYRQRYDTLDRELEQYGETVASNMDKDKSLLSAKISYSTGGHFKATRNWLNKVAAIVLQQKPDYYTAKLEAKERLLTKMDPDKDPFMIHKLQGDIEKARLDLEFARFGSADRRIVANVEALETALEEANIRLDAAENAYYAQVGIRDLRATEAGKIRDFRKDINGNYLDRFRDTKNEGYDGTKIEGKIALAAADRVEKRRLAAAAAYEKLKAAKRPDLEAWLKKAAAKRAKDRAVDGVDDYDAAGEADEGGSGSDADEVDEVAVPVIPDLI